jgi:CRISPR system Cascade subunit CasA
MNLTTEAWIPVVRRDGRPETVSLRGVFERGHELQDLAVRPHERIALMRLLICITQAALDGPDDLEDWETCLPRLAPAALDYLGHWIHAFELFGEGQRFLQVTGLTKPDAKKRPADAGIGDDDEGGSPSKLDLALATGNNVTLFDNAGGSDRAFRSCELALMLLTFQCFSPGGTIGVALWNGMPTVGWSSYPKAKPGKSEHAPCLAGGMLHAFLRSDNVLESVQFNLMTKSQSQKFFGSSTWGRPVWEMMPNRPDDAPAVTNASRSYLGRLVPLARAVSLADDGRSILLANGLLYPSYPAWREPSASVVTRKVKDQPERQLVRASIEKAAWRELHALTVKGASHEIGGPAALQNMVDERAFDLWVGGLVAGKAKLVDTTESVFHVRAATLGDPGWNAYERGVLQAEATSLRVIHAVTIYHRELGDKLDRPDMRNRRDQVQGKACAQFWTQVEVAVPRLLEVAADPAVLGLDNRWRKTGWGESVWRAARAAYEAACPHGTPRQIRAYAKGLKGLFDGPAGGPLGGKKERLKDE